MYSFCAMFVLQLLFDMLVGSLNEDLGEDPMSWTHVNSTLTKKSLWPTLIISHAIFPPILGGLFSGSDYENCHKM